MAAGDFGIEPRMPAIPDLRTAKVEDAVKVMKEWIEVRQGARGDVLDRAVTMRDLLNAGIATPGAINGLFPGQGVVPIVNPDTSPAIPPTPTNLEATGALKTIILTWDFARGYSRLAYFELWRSTTDAIGNATKIAQVYGGPYADEVGPGKTYFYWVRAVSDAGVSPFNAVAGTRGSTGLDIPHVLDTLTGQITESQLYTSLGQRINLIDAPFTVPNSVDARVRSETLSRISADEALYTHTNQQYSTLNGSLAGVQTQVTTQATALSALTTSTNTQFSSIGTTLSLYDTRITTNATNVSGLTTALSTLQSTVGANTVAIQSEQTARINADNSISAKYSVKVDVNGYVAGFGLISEANNSTPYSSFIIRADSFSIASPSGPGIEPALPFIVRTTATTINGVNVPVGVYMREAFLQNGTITNAKIGNLAVDDAKIANMSVAKLTAGRIGVSEYIESTNFLSGSTGFRIHGNGNAEFQNAVMRGTVYATAGQIGGISIDSTGIQSTNYNGTVGWRINGDGSALFGSNATFKGQLSAATGSFAGTLSGATGTFSGNLSAASGTFYGSGTFSGNLAAAGGTFSGTLTASAINAVNTLNVAGNAITGLSAATGGVSTIPAGLGNYLCAASITMPESGSGVLITLNVNMNAGSSASVILNVMRGSTIIGSTGVSLLGGFASTYSFTMLDTSPGVGTVTYNFFANNPSTGPGSNVNVTVTASSIVISGAKR